MLVLRNSLVNVPLSTLSGDLIIIVLILVSIFTTSSDLSFPLITGLAFYVLFTLAKIFALPFELFVFLIHCFTLHLRSIDGFGRGEVRSCGVQSVVVVSRDE